MTAREDFDALRGNPFFAGCPAPILRAGLSRARSEALRSRTIDRVTVEVTKAPVRGIDTNIRTLTYRGEVIARLEAADGRGGWTDRDEGRMRRFIEDVEQGR